MKADDFVAEVRQRGSLIGLRVRNLRRNVVDGVDVEEVTIREDGQILNLKRRAFPNGPYGDVAFARYQVEFWDVQLREAWSRAAEKEKQHAEGLRRLADQSLQRAAVFEGCSTHPLDESRPESRPKSQAKSKRKGNRE